MIVTRGLGFPGKGTLVTSGIIRSLREAVVPGIPQYALKAEVDLSKTLHLSLTDAAVYTQNNTSHTTYDTDYSLLKVIPDSNNIHLVSSGISLHYVLEINNLHLTREDLSVHINLQAPSLKLEVTNTHPQLHLARSFGFGVLIDEGILQVS